MRDTARAVGLFYDYCTACNITSVNQRTQLRKFMFSLENGTIDTNEKDPTGLYWSPTGLTKAKRLIGSLSKFIYWVNQEESLSNGSTTFVAPTKNSEKLT
ncbi:site-specific integrase, partial [Vibrio parahaemolyticus]|nr:site-specific integrase [Vibrio parahaemolyticus]